MNCKLHKRATNADCARSSDVKVSVIEWELFEGKFTYPFLCVCECVTCAI